MGAPDPTRIIKGGWRLAHSPTDLSAAWPHGGTGMGLIQDVFVQPFYAEYQIYAEEFGTVCDTILTGSQYIFSATLRTWDDDAIAACFPNTTAGSSSGTRYVWEDPDSTYYGTLGSARAKSLIATPNNPLSHPAVLFLSAVPLLEEQAQLDLDFKAEGLMPVIFRALPTDSGVPVQIGLLEDLSLT